MHSEPPPLLESHIFNIHHFMWQEPHPHTYSSQTAIPHSHPIPGICIFCSNTRVQASLHLHQLPGHICIKNMILRFMVHVHSTHAPFKPKATAICQFETPLSTMIQQLMKCIPPPTHQTFNPSDSLVDTAGKVWPCKAWAQQLKPLSLVPLQGIPTYYLQFSPSNF